MGSHCTASLLSSSLAQGAASGLTFESSQEALMRVNQKRWLYYTLVAIAVTGSLVSLLALFELGSSRWTILVVAPVSLVR